MTSSTSYNSEIKYTSQLSKLVLSMSLTSLLFHILALAHRMPLMQTTLMKITVSCSNGQMYLLYAS